MAFALSEISKLVKLALILLHVSCHLYTESILIWWDNSNIGTTFAQGDKYDNDISIKIGFLDETCYTALLSC